MSVDVTEVLTKAWAAVQAAKIPEPLQELALGRAIDLYAGGYVPPQVGQPSPPAQQPSTQQPGRAEGAGTGPVDEKELYRRMSEGTGVPVETLERLVHLDGGVPKMLLKKSLLPKKMSTAQKAITLILSVATHYLTGDEEVDLGPIRDECKQLNQFDANFMANIGKIPDITITGPRGATRKSRYARLSCIPSRMNCPSTT